MSQNNAALLHMTADTLGKSLLQGLIQEIRILPDVWQKLSEAKQTDVIERLEQQVRNAATIAVHTIAGATSWPPTRPIRTSGRRRSWQPRLPPAASPPTSR
ncbi:hypothetical protein ACSEU7_27100 [Pseudomonas aeruginosa]